MANIKAVQSPEDSWENGEFGREEAEVRVSPDESSLALDKGLELQMISIRLQSSLIEQLKFIATFHQVGYQPLIRDVLARWSRTEILSIARQMQEQIQANEAIEAARKRA